MNCSDWLGRKYIHAMWTVSYKFSPCSPGSAQLSMIQPEYQDKNLQENASEAVAPQRSIIGFAVNILMVLIWLVAMAFCFRILVKMSIGYSVSLLSVQVICLRSTCTP